MTEKSIDWSSAVWAALAVSCPTCATPSEIFCGCHEGVFCGGCLEDRPCDRGKICSGRFARVARMAA